MQYNINTFNVPSQFIPFKTDPKQFNGIIRIFQFPAKLKIMNL